MSGQEPVTGSAGNGPADAGPAAQQALLGRPAITIRSRVVAVFFVIFVLLCGITTAAVLFISEFRTKLQFLETVGNYSFEIQQARRFEKNFFLYGSNLLDAVTNVHTAHNLLDKNADEVRSVVGDRRYGNMLESLSRYEQLLEELLAASEQDPGHAPDAQQIEVSLRRYGAQILSDAQEMLDRERMAIHAMLSSFTLIAIGFLVFMLFIMLYVANFVISSVIRPLDRFVSYAGRIGAGDYSPILPTRKYRDEFSNLAIAINRMLDELKLRQEQLLQSGKMAAVGTLTSGIAHELNNPLNNIGITLEALIQDFTDYPDEKKLKMLDDAYVQVERASGTVRNLLDFTRKEKPVFSSVSVRRIVEPALRLVQNEMHLAAVEAEMTLSGELPEITGNPRNLQQVFLNLFLNAIQAMPDGGSLRVSAARDGDFVRVDVTDTGTGIPEDQIDRIFEPFFTTKDPGVGTGLGLSVSYGIIEKHNGRMTVESQVGKGTTFSVYLPISDNHGKSRS